MTGHLLVTLATRPCLAGFQELLSVTPFLTCKSGIWRVRNASAVQWAMLGLLSTTPSFTTLLQSVWR